MLLISLHISFLLSFLSSPPDYNQGYDYPRQDDSQLYSQSPFGREPAPVYGPPSNTSRYHG